MMLWIGSDYAPHVLVFTLLLIEIHTCRSSFAKNRPPYQRNVCIDRLATNANETTSLQDSPHPIPGTTTTPLKTDQRSADKLNVAVVGAGAVGCYYGARLYEAGHTVKFLLRGQNYDVATSQGLRVQSIDGDIWISPEHLLAFPDTQDMGTADWVIVALKSSALDAIPDLIYPLLTPETRVLVIMNGLIEDDLIHLLKAKQGIDQHQPLTCCRALYGGMALVCCNRLEPGVVDHSYAGLLTAGVATSSSSPDLSDELAFEQLWKGTKIMVAYEPSLLRGRWKKMMWNMPFNGISVAMGGITVDKIVQDPGLRALANIVMDETISVAHADLDRMYGKGAYEPLTERDKDQMMSLSDGMGPYRTSTMLDLVERRPMEVEYLFRKPLTRAYELGVPVPHLETIVLQVEAFQRMYNLR